MTVVRRNILTSPHTKPFLEGVVALSQRSTAITPAQLNQSAIVQRAPGARLVGPAVELDRPLSWWDLFTWWHIAAMSWPTATGNRAHQGPVFLPWHRLFLRRLEEAIQALSGDQSFGLPYWDWGQDGMLGPTAQLSSRIWSLLGAAQGVVTQGTVGQLRVRLRGRDNPPRVEVSAPRRIWRDAGRGAAGLPTQQDQAWTLGDGFYDGPPWSWEADSFRNKLEGFQDPREGAQRPGPWMHNRVHVWIGGDMAPGTSPNDPLFWLNHCNVDRIWQGWMRRPGRAYRPLAGEGPAGQRIDDPLFSIVWPSKTPREVLDPGDSGLRWYRYDALPG
jgi:tyrosinase